MVTKQDFEKHKKMLIRAIKDGKDVSEEPTTWREFKKISDDTNRIRKSIRKSYERNRRK